MGMQVPSMVVTLLVRMMHLRLLPPLIRRAALVLCLRSFSAALWIFRICLDLSRFLTSSSLSLSWGGGVCGIVEGGLKDVE